MLHQKFLNRFVIRQVIWAFIITYLAAALYVVFFNNWSYTTLIVPVVLFYLAFKDAFQTKHTIRKNYPIIGRLRYMLEEIRPELRQYFWEGELDGKPFNRRERSIVYQRAKNEKQTVSFGMQDDPNRVGYQWASHSVYPKDVSDFNFRTIIGNTQCKKPYSASIYNISAMSYGALSKTAITSLNKGAKLGDFAHNTGEGGISEYHRQGGDLIWKTGTGNLGGRDKDGSLNDE